RELSNTSPRLNNYLFFKFPDRIFCLFLLLRLFYACFLALQYFPNKYIDSCLGKRFRVTDLFFCCRSKSTRAIRLPMAQLYLAVACSDYMPLPFFYLKSYKHISK
ncbi:hypothetical protein, partial [Dysgonomonas sp. HGC4]|uniref:hypothetical protein n=1 Tax=Dysgonomonas sp. HGC4 TaxID=1658009 RepID=UPI001C88244D